LTSGRPQAHGLEGLIGLAYRRRAAQVVPTVEVQLRGVDLVEVVQHLGQRGRAADLTQRALQGRLQHQGQEAHHEVAPHPLRGPVKHGAQLQARLQLAKGALEAPEFPVGLGHGLRFQLGVEVVSQKTRSSFPEPLSFRQTPVPGKPGTASVLI